MKIQYHWKNLQYSFKDLIFKAKHKKSKVEVWNAFYGIAVYIDETIGTWLKIGVSGHPGELTMEQWEEILKKIQHAFHLISLDDLEIRVKHAVEIEEGLNLFRKWYFHLWD